jgi:hypothetical protein
LINSCEVDPLLAIVRHYVLQRAMAEHGKAQYRVKTLGYFIHRRTPQRNWTPPFTLIFASFRLQISILRGFMSMPTKVASGKYASNENSSSPVAQP